MTLRELEDFDQVMQIEEESFSQPWSREGLGNLWLMPTSLFFVVEEKGQILGYCGLQRVLEEADFLNVVVKQDRRREGIGSFMFQGAIRIASELGVTCFHLDVRKSNEAAIRLYRNNGFVEDGLRRNYYSQPTEDAILMTMRV